MLPVANIMLPVTNVMLSVTNIILSVTNVTYHNIMAGKFEIRIVPTYYKGYAILLLHNGNGTHQNI